MMTMMDHQTREGTSNQVCDELNFDIMYMKSQEDYQTQKVPLPKVTIIDDNEFQDVKAKKINNRASMVQL